MNGPKKTKAPGARTPGADTAADSAPGGSAAVQGPSAAWNPYPREMLEARHWVLRKGKAAHYVDGTPRRAPVSQSRDEEKLATYKDAQAALVRGGGAFDGLGFTLGGGFWGVAVYGAVEPEGVARRVIVRDEELLAGAVRNRCYVELSLDGGGFNVIGRGELGFKPFRCVEIAALCGRKHFFAMTGERALPVIRGLWLVGDRWMTRGPRPRPGRERVWQEQLRLTWEGA